MFVRRRFDQSQHKARTWLLPCVVIVGSLALLAAPVLAGEKKEILLPPTGDLTVGRTTFYWTDNSRNESFTPEPNDKHAVASIYHGLEWSAIPSAVSPHPRPVWTIRASKR